MNESRKQYFKNYPDADIIYFTADGMAFLRKEKAEMHASKLRPASRQKVEEVTRKEYEAAGTQKPKTRSKTAAPKKTEGSSKKGSAAPKAEAAKKEDTGTGDPVMDENDKTSE